MAIAWRIRKQLLFLVIFIIFVFGIVFGIINLFSSNATCTDNIKNQSEEDVDCGGGCEACIGKADDLIVFWTRFFETSKGRYEVASYVNNPNLLLGIGKLEYKIRLYDSDNISIAIKEGSIFVNPRENVLIFEKDFETYERAPARASIEFSSPIKWKRFEKERPNILVSGKKFENTDTGSRLKVTVENQSLYDINNVYLSAILMGEDGNVVGVSQSNFDWLAGESAREVFFTWRKAFDPEPTSIEIIARINLTQ